MTMSVRYATKLLRAHRLVQAQAHHKRQTLAGNLPEKEEWLDEESYGAQCAVWL